MISIQSIAHLPAFTMSELHYLVPTPQPEVQEIFKVYETTYQFYREAEYRQELEQYCEWYYQVAEQHQQELEQMRGDINVLGWVCRLRG